MEVEVNYLKGRRLRMFAGPNGSGKSTIFNQIHEKFDVGVYLNADDLEKDLKRRDEIDLENFSIQNVNIDFFNNFVNSHSLTKKAMKDGYKINLEINNNKIISKSLNTNSYEASLIVDFIRKLLFIEGKKFSFETVMSHHSKIDILNIAKENYYKTYLYFISTESEKINISRVKQRVILGGHPVEEDKIKERYYKSLYLLKEAVKNSFRSFIFDNSEKETKLILEVEKGENILFHNKEIPKWVDKFLLS